MRDTDMARLARPYSKEAVNTQSPEQLWADALEVRVPCLRSLVANIYQDLDEERFGIRWWREQVDVHRRILIGDYLFQCTKSIEINLVEANLHLLEALGCFDQDEQSVRVTSRPDGRAGLSQRRPVSAAGDIHVPLGDMHVAGFFRAIGSALDCLGGSIVGVVALPKPILKADYGVAKNALLAIKPPAPGHEHQLAFRTRLDLLETDAGPSSWMTWTMAQRNTLVHRARRLLAIQIHPRGGLVDVRSAPLIRAIHHLQRDPGFSEVDMWRDPANADALSEDAETTMRGVFGSAMQLVEGASAALLETWRERRASPSLIPQPAERQWPAVERPESTGFPGYHPGEWPYAPGALVSADDVLHRISAAALPDAVRDRVW